MKIIGQIGMHPFIYIWCCIPIILSIYLLQYFGNDEPLVFEEDSRLNIIAVYLFLAGCIYFLLRNKKLNSRLIKIHILLTTIGCFGLWLYEFCYNNSSVLDDQTTLKSRIINLTFIITYYTAPICLLFGQLIFILNLIKSYFQSSKKVTNS